MDLQEFDEYMNSKVHCWERLHQHYLNLYKELTDEEVKERFILWDGEEPEVP